MMASSFLYCDSVTSSFSYCGVSDTKCRRPNSESVSGFKVRAVIHNSSIYTCRVAEDDCSFRSMIQPLGMVIEGANPEGTFQAVDVIGQQEIAETFDMCYGLVHQSLETNDLAKGREVYCLITRRGYESNIFLGNHLIRMFSQCGGLLEAVYVFMKLPMPDVNAWCAIISAHNEHAQGKFAIKLYYQMHQSTVKPNGRVFVAVLKACASDAALVDGRLIHSHVIETGIESNIFVSSTLIDMYVKCGCLEDARRVFDKLPQQNMVTWTAMLAGYAQHGYGKDALQFFHLMEQQGIKPNQITYLSILKACSSIPSLEQGKFTHSSILESGFESNIYVANTLIDMYAKCGSLEDARTVFDGLLSRDVCTWNAMIGACAQHGSSQEALCLFQQMQHNGIHPRQITFVSILKACANIGALDEGRLIHADVIGCGFELDVFVGSALINIYAGCGRLQDAHRIFDKLPRQNMVTWGAIITGYAQHGHGQEALQLFEQMQEQGMEPDEVIFISTLKACSSIKALDQGQILHILVIECGFESSAFVGNTLIDMYGTCGSLDYAFTLFNRLPKRDVVTWNALISGYAQHEHAHGYGQKALLLFQQMIEEAVKPDDITFVSALKICSSIAALNQGKLIHAHAIESGCELDVFIGNTLIDMYAKCGSLGNACCIFERLPKRDVVTLNAMISSLGRSGCSEKALILYEEICKDALRPDDATFVCLLSACSHVGLVKEGCHYFKLMKEVHGLIPVLDHYYLMVDLLGRAGHLNEAEDLLQTMPCPTDPVGWISLLSHCQTQHNVEFGRRCFDRIVTLDCEIASSYVLMSNIYANAGMYDAADSVEEQRKDTVGATKKPGKAFIEVDNEVHEFIVGGMRHPQSEAIYSRLQGLCMEMKKEGYIPQVGLVRQSIPDLEKEDVLCGHCEKLAIAFGLISTPEGTTIRVSKNLRVCSDCHSASKIISKIERRDIIIMDAYRIHHFEGGTCSCKDYY